MKFFPCPVRSVTLIQAMCCCIGVLIAGLIPLLRQRAAIRLAREQLAERQRAALQRQDTLLQSVQGIILLFHGIAAQAPLDEHLSEKLNLAINRAETLLDELRRAVETTAEESNS